MWYAALNQGADYLASHAGFIPRAAPDFRATTDSDPATGCYVWDVRANLPPMRLYADRCQPLERPAPRLGAASWRLSRIT
jgi:hypothetical protein